MENQEKLRLIEDIADCIGETMELDSGDSDKEEILLGLASFGEKVASLPVKRTRGQWMKEWRNQKPERGSYAFLSKELLVLDEESYKNYLRLSKTHFDFLLSLIKDDIQRSDTVMRSAIPAEEKLAMTLRFLGTGKSYISLDYQSRLSKSAISCFVPEVCNALYRRLKSSYLKFPRSPSDWEAIAKEFAVKWQFPNCLGALDGKHISFRSQRKDGAFFHNYKGTNSIILLDLVDAHCKFIFVDVGCNGRSNDAGVFLQSKLNTILQEEKSLPQSAAIGNNRFLPYVVVGDDAFPLQAHLMKPYPYHSHCPKKQVFNQRLSRARHVVEHAFGIFSNRFRVFLAPMCQKVETVQTIVLACCALHNYLIESGETSTEGVGNVQDTGNISSAASSSTYNPRKGEAEIIRQNFSNYFNEEGKVDWLKP